MADPKERQHKRLKLMPSTPQDKKDKCHHCHQLLNSVVFYKKHFSRSIEEAVALTDERLINHHNHLDYMIDLFSIYDSEGHLCPFYTNLEECGPLYMSGYIKPVIKMEKSIAIPAHNIGPIVSWWRSSYDVEDEIDIGISTELADYYLMKCSTQYRTIFKIIQETVHLYKTIIKYLDENFAEKPKLCDLIQYIEESESLEEVEPLILRNAQLICDEVTEYDRENKNDRALMSLPCMRELLNSTAPIKTPVDMNPENEEAGESPKWSKVVATKLVKDIFKNCFFKQIDQESGNEFINRRSLRGHNLRRLGSNFRNRNIDKSENVVPEVQKLSKSVQMTRKSQEIPSRTLHFVYWVIKSETSYKKHECYQAALVDNMYIEIGDYVEVRPMDVIKSPYILKIVFMYDKPPHSMFHGIYFASSSESVLGELADDRELFLTDSCEDVYLGSILQKVQVVFKSNWLQNDDEFFKKKRHGKSYFYSKRLDENRFVDINYDKEIDIRKGCCSCIYRSEKERLEQPRIINNHLEWKNEQYKIGTGIFLFPNAYEFPDVKKDIPWNNQENMLWTSNTKFCKILFPEYYRVDNDIIKGSNDDTAGPFIIGIIEDIRKLNRNILLSVRLCYRPENTINFRLSYTKDLNLLYYTDTVIETTFDKVVGKCYLSYHNNIDSAIEWSKKGPFRFYFIESYDPVKQQYGYVSNNGKKIGHLNYHNNKIISELPPEFKKISKTLQCMDLFSGCGGLSEGLHRSGLAETKWAIEIELSEANSFQMNNPKCKVFAADCNKLMNYLMDNNGKEVGLPSKGDVDLLVGGPPCQGFSGMNRFNERDYSTFKNSLVVSFLSYCDYYRPKYIIMENVRNFVSYKKSMALKTTIRCLLAMGYQVTFGILQAGNYGIPQARRRFILMAASPGCILPTFPEPLFVFNSRDCQLNMKVDDLSYYSGCQWYESAPYRALSVRDAIANLPKIKSGWSKLEMTYKEDAATSHYQRIMRRKEDEIILRDHICKRTTALVQARISYIPILPGADWRYLPNTDVFLNDRLSTEVLCYRYRLKGQWRQSEPPHGVCECQVGGKCNPSDRQENTLIPWSLSHTADRNNQWAGNYGRLEWDGYFGTTLTNPQPMSKQGRVLHPDQNRIISVRECARSQGFPDDFKFFGTILQKHRQIGNAVPPPLAEAIGRSFLEALQ